MDKHNDLLAIAYRNKISLISLNDPKVILKTFTMEVEQALINCIKFYNDPQKGLRLIVGGNGKWMRFFDIDGADTPSREIPVDTFVNHFSIDKNREKMAVCYDAKEVDLYDLKTGQKITQLVGHDDFGFSSDFRDDGVTLATGNQDLTTRIWDLRKSEEARVVLPSSRNNVGVVKFLKGGAYMAIGESMNYFNLYHWDNWSVREELDYFGQFAGFDWIGDSHDSLFIGFQHYYVDLVGGILELKINDM
jgi:WD40 repeat protein